MDSLDEHCCGVVGEFASHVKLKVWCSNPAVTDLHRSDSSATERLATGVKKSLVLGDVLNKQVPVSRVTESDLVKHSLLSSHEFRAEVEIRSP